MSATSMDFSAQREGKTTAMRMMLGLIRKDAGEIELLGSTNIGLRVKTLVPLLKHRVSQQGECTTEFGVCLCLCALPKKSWTTEIDRVLDLVGLSSRANDRVGNYSLGMKQRLGIARALLGSPKLLFWMNPPMV